jgi:hypothetical protein
MLAGDYLGIENWFDDSKRHMRNKHVTCPHTVFVTDKYTERNATTPSRWSISSTTEIMKARTVEETLGPYWEKMPERGVKIRTKSKSPFYFASTGLYMLTYALMHRSDRTCIHVFGFNFEQLPDGSHQQGHRWPEERALFSYILRAAKGVFLHPTPALGRHANESLHYGLKPSMW